MRDLTNEELEYVAGGTDPAPSKGNNGWGNGGDDGTNKGSDNGAFKEAFFKFFDLGR